jgi:amino acid adenylation domain-containing protein
VNGQSTIEFLSYVRSLGINILADGDRVRVNAPAGVMTPEIRHELAIRKPEILQFLKVASLANRLLPPPIERVPRDRELPLSFPQMRLWMLDQLDPDSATYNIQSCYLLTGKLDVQALEQSLTEIVRRHEALRTCFLMVDGRPVQQILSPEPFQISFIDLQSFPKSELQQEMTRLASVDANKPFDLGKAPLMRAALLKVADEEHVLLFNVHHIASDEWSLGVFERELSVLYKSFHHGLTSSLPELPVQYADFAVWQREWLQGEALQTHLDYWKGRLSGSLPVLELPADRPRPSIQTHNGSTVCLVFPPDLTESLNNLSRQEGVTLFVTLLAAFNVLLLRYTGQEDLMVGTPTANRNRPEIEGLIGFFVNTLVMRNDLSANPSFRDLLGRVQETALAANAHQDLPFEKLVQELNPERDLSRSPVLQVLFSFLNTPVHPLELPELQAIRLKPDGVTSKFDLSLYAIEIPEGISCTFEYNKDLFDAERIQRMLRHLQVLVEDIVRDPGKRLSELQFLTAAERHQLLVEWNDTRVSCPTEATLHELFEAQAQRTPDAVAVEFEGNRLRYRELDERANQLARHLKGQGVGPDTLVGLFHERTQDMMVALLGILKAGAAYIPLDPSFPEGRLNYMMESSGMHVLITHSTLDGRLPMRPEFVVRLDSDYKEIAKHSGHRLTPPQAHSNNLAYVLYTSGSTGNPKGVAIEHSAIVNLLLSMQHEPGFTDADTMLAITTLSFDIAAMELFLPLICGGRLVIASREDTHDPARLMQRMEVSRCSVMQATPATWRALINAGWSGAPNLKILCGGEALSSDFAANLKSRCRELWNMYGPTETTVWSTIWKINTVNGPISIGRPIANTEVFVLDGNRKLLPVGVAGELYIGGAGLARGYLHRAELTKERFIESPFTDGARIYRTGDLARWLPDGRLECLGRVDNQVKIRGFRIELEEIEAILGRHTAVRQCVVLAREYKSGDKKLVAYYESQDGTPIAVSDLREYLRNTLPDYMIPVAWVVMAALPLTHNGKVDRNALPIPEDQPPDPSSKHIPPRNETEKALVTIWGDVLEIKDVGVNDDFFDLGGHSLSAVNLMGEVERFFGIRFPLMSLFHAPTIAQFSEVVDRHRSMQGNSRKFVDLEIILHQVRNFIVENYLGGEAKDLKNSDSFLEHEIIEPMRLYELVDFIEETFGITIENDERMGNNLDSINSVSLFLLQRLNGTVKAEKAAIADDMIGVNF